MRPELPAVLPGVVGERDVPLVERDVDPLGSARLGLDEVTGCDRLIQICVEIGRGRQVTGQVVTVLPVVGMQGQVVDQAVCALEHLGVPGREAGHLVLRAAGDHEVDTGVNPPHDGGRLGGQFAVGAGAPVADLPRPVHLVAQAPGLDAVRLLGAVTDPQVGQRGPGPEVGVLDEVPRLRDAPGAQVDGVHHLGADQVQPAGHLAEAEGVALDAPPGEVEPRRTVLDRPDAVLPVVARGEVAARVAHDRGA